jgi:hypothetical protein
MDINIQNNGVFVFYLFVFSVMNFIIMSCIQKNGSITPKVANDLCNMSVDTQVFYVHPFQDTILYCENGTVLFFPKEIFETNTQPSSNDSIEISIVEAYTVGELIRSRLSTITNSGDLLETAGMIYIYANHHGNEIHLKDGKHVLVSFNEDYENPMYTYNLYLAKNKNDLIVWDSIPLCLPIQPAYDTIWSEDGHYELVEVDNSWSIFRKFRDNIFESDKMEWLNLDHPSNPDAKNFEVSAETPVSDNGVYAFIIFNGKRSILCDIAKNPLDKVNFPFVPANSSFNFLIYYAQAGKLFMQFKKDVIITRNTFIESEFKEVDIVEFNSFVDSLAWK